VRGRARGHGYDGRATVGHRCAVVRDAAARGALRRSIHGRGARSLRVVGATWDAIRAHDPRENAHRGLARGSHVPRVDREWLLTASVFPSRSGRDVAAHDVHGAWRGIARGLVGGRATRPRAIDRRSDPLSAISQGPVWIALSRRRSVQRWPGPDLTWLDSIRR